MPGQQDPETLDAAQQILIELGRLQARNEELEKLLFGQANKEEAEAERIRQRNAAAVRLVCRLRWLLQPQNGAVSIGDRIYRGRGPVRDRNTQRILKHGSEFDAAADDARVLEESGYAEIVTGREHVTYWTPPVIIPADAAPAPAAGDADAWHALAVHG